MCIWEPYPNWHRKEGQNVQGMCCLWEKQKGGWGEGRHDDKLARTHQRQAQPVFFKIRPSVRVAILS